MGTPDFLLAGPTWKQKHESKENTPKPCSSTAVPHHGV